MWPFESSKDNLEEQIKLHEAEIKAAEEELEVLPEEGKSAASDERRVELVKEISRAKVSIAQNKEAAEKLGRDVGAYDYDQSMFED